MKLISDKRDLVGAAAADLVAVVADPAAVAVDVAAVAAADAAAADRKFWL